MSKELSQLDKVLVDTIQKVTDVAGQVTSKTIDFASEQIPDVVHQLLMFNLVKELVYVVVCFGIIGAFIKGWFVLRKANKDTQGDYDEGVVLYSTLGGFASIVLFIVGLCSIMDALKIYVAPKLYLLEYVAHLIR